MKLRILGLLAASLVAFATTASAQKSAGEVVDDNTVNASVKAALGTAKDIPNSQVVVETYKGTVLLSGFVESQAQKDAVGKIAKDVDGVKNVHNALAIQPESKMGAKLDDSVLTGKVKAALMDDKDVKSGQINVETKNAVVSLGGFVDNAKIKSRAVEVAKGVAGVKDVVDAMHVRD